MIEIGRTQTLTIGRLTEQGAYLTDGGSEVLLPNRFAGLRPEVGSKVRVFVYTDSEDRPIATTQTPAAEAGGYAYMECVDATRVGAFMNWGLDKDLLVPFAEQHSPMRATASYVVRVGLDKLTGRLVGTTKLSRHFAKAPLSISPGEALRILAYRVGEPGMLVVVDDLYGGLVVDPRETLRVGDTSTAYVQRVRDDGRISLGLVKEGYAAAVSESPRLMQLLKDAGGYLPYGDRSSPDDIQRVFGMSKGTYKKLIGGLFREGAITIEPHGIRLSKPGPGL